MKNFTHSWKKQLTLWQKIKLFFTRPHITIDWGHLGDLAVVQEWKYLDGVMVLTNEYKTDLRNEL